MSQRAGWLSVMRFHPGVVTDIIEVVRLNWVMVGVTALVSLAACTSGTATTGRTVAELPVNPTPTASGQVVVLAGNGRSGLPVDGAYAVRTPVTPVGRVLALPDGSLLFPVQYGGWSAESRLARLTPDGRIHLRTDILGGNEYTSYAMSGNDLWILQPSVDAPGRLTKASLNGNGKTTMLSWSDEGANRFTFEDSRGHQVPAAERHRLAAGWNATALGVRHDGTPIIAAENGDLYQLLGKDRLRRWIPPGYEKASDSAHAIARLFPEVIISDGEKGLHVIGQQGIVHVPGRGSATGVRFPGAEQGDQLSVVGAVASTDGELLIAGSARGLLRADARGRVRFEMQYGDGKSCTVPASLSAVGADKLGGIAERPGGVLVVTGLRCGRLYGLRLAR